MTRSMVATTFITPLNRSNLDRYVTRLPYNGRRADRFLVSSQRRKRKTPQVLRCVHKSIFETTGLQSDDRDASCSIAWPRVLIGPLHVEVINLCIPRLLIQGFRPLVGAR
jgi:hypothetical protein